MDKVIYLNCSKYKTNIREKEKAANLIGEPLFTIKQALFLSLLAFCAGVTTTYALIS